MQLALLSRISSLSHHGVSCLLLGMLLAPSARADEAGDWKALGALRTQLGEEPVKSNPTQARQMLQAFTQGGALDPIVAAEAKLRIAEITRTQLKQPAEAMALLQADWQLTQQKINAEKPVGVMFLNAMALALVEQKKIAEAKALLEANQAAILAGGTSGIGNLENYASQALNRLVDAQQTLRAPGAKPEDTVKLLQTSLTQMPVFLDPDRQRSLTWTKAWMYQRLMKALVQTGRAPEALQWGKLYFAEAAYDQKVMEGATNALREAWISQGDIGVANAFVQAQSGSNENNPLRAVKFPALDKGAITFHLERFQKWQAAWNNRDRVPGMITLEMAQGNWTGAMKMALSLIQSQPGAPDGPQQIARVLKGWDGSIGRANQFLSSLEGTAPNPVPTFLAEAEAAEDAAP